MGSPNNAWPRVLVCLVNSTQVTAGEGRGEGERAAPVASTGRLPHRARRIPFNHHAPDKFSNLSYDAAAPPRLGERPSVSWLVEPPNLRPTPPSRTTPDAHVP